MEACVQEVLLEFATEELPQLIKEIEAIRLLLVRLAHRNRPRSQKPIPTVQAHLFPTTRLRLRPPNGGRIDEAGRKFVWVKKEVSPEKFARRNSRRRPTHRGKRKKKDSKNSIFLRRAETTFAQLVPEAKALPRRVQKLVSVLYDAIFYNEPQKMIEPLKFHRVNNVRPTPVEKFRGFAGLGGA